MFPWVQLYISKFKDITILIFQKACLRGKVALKYLIGIRFLNIQDNIHLLTCMNYKAVNHMWLQLWSIQILKTRYVDIFIHIRLIYVYTQIYRQYICTHIYVHIYIPFNTLMPFALAQLAIYALWKCQDPCGKAVLVLMQFTDYGLGNNDTWTKCFGTCAHVRGREEDPP